MTSTNPSGYTAILSWRSRYSPSSKGTRWPNTCSVHRCASLLTEMTSPEGVSTTMTAAGIWRSTLSVWMDRAIEEPSGNAMIFVPLPRLVFPTHSPLFGRYERAVYVALREVYLPAFFEVFGQRFEDRAENSLLDPPLKAAVGGVVGQVALG